MKPVNLVLTTESGHELGRLPLAGVAVADPGEASGATATRPAEEMVDLLARIHEALAAEGLRLNQDDVGFRIGVSRTLLGSADGDTMLIPVPVTESPKPAAIPVPAETDSQPEVDDLNLDDLFNLDTWDEGEPDG